MVSNPLESEWWPITAALAWILNKDLDFVGKILREPNNFVDYFKSREAECNDALRVLIDNLKAGKVHACGRTYFQLAFDPTLAEKQVQSLNVLKDIDAREWFAQREIKVEKDHTTSVRFLTPLYGYDHGYNSVLVKSAEIVRTWPKVSKHVLALSSAEAECQRWLCSEIARSPDYPPQSKVEFKKEAMEKIPNLSGEAFQRAWRRAIERSGAKSWGRPGRPSANRRV